MNLRELLHKEKPDGARDGTQDRTRPICPGGKDAQAKQSAHRPAKQTQNLHKLVPERFDVGRGEGNSEPGAENAHGHGQHAAQQQVIALSTCALVGPDKVGHQCPCSKAVDELWELKDLRKTCATYHDEHIPESSIEILGHSVAGVTYRHYAHRAPLAFRAITTLPQPSAFSADENCPCCKRRFDDAS